MRPWPVLPPQEIPTRRRKIGETSRSEAAGLTPVSAPGGAAGAAGGVDHGHRNDRVEVAGRGGRRVAELLGDKLQSLLDEGGEELLLRDDADEHPLEEE